MYDTGDTRISFDGLSFTRWLIDASKSIACLYQNDASVAWWLRRHLVHVTNIASRVRVCAMALENYRTTSRERMWQYDDMWHNTAAVIDTFTNRIVKRVVVSSFKKKESFEAIEIMIFFVQKYLYRYADCRCRKLMRTFKHLKMDTFILPFKSQLAM